ncbi:hypothetical protein GLOIN_2v810277 [Rhizophagus irregularis DAOM 181602=DAOM 197198]|uniref:Crinkler effector protein N-terminal domain-containing protein n=2 Tax=Rhizophagus irregularis (strain DAOM 181602 / DAOM 197198 / MUCL 43194) TaxID=747089 RepID=A0A2H5SCS3_RHIID|nr:hypothetical protein GLOIN_2v810277 [Rhizophagus irregularis DAOM 181602=DAOM 197198]POG60016.1 hypothetical protein GLOIN_2v810277 [Rhizophagus irregularis DAOM 181602=DAOM 197198]|eukprot:XP_025166882.1 hypothetical protein GLOIN_2v810277 [Rhizophagus irregularis DAOM 181602=DAOM 197198]
MRMSLNCLLLGENSDKSFLVDIGKEIIVINGRNHTKIRDIKISHIKYLVFCQMNDENIKPNALVLWKVDVKWLKIVKIVLKYFLPKMALKHILEASVWKPRYLLTKYFTKKKFEENKIIREAIHIIVQILEAADSVSVDREQKRLKVVSFKMVLEEFDKNILVNKSQKLYPGFTVNIVGHFSKDKMPISCLNYVDMRLDATESGKEN